MVTIALFMVGMLRPSAIMKTNTSVPYEVGFECGVIVAKMDILTDNGA